MFSQIVTRHLPVDVPTAYAWLTDYQSADLAIMDREPGVRTIQRLAPNLLRVVNPRPYHPTIIEDTVITLRPPDHWTGEGTLTSRGRKVATYTLDYRLTPEIPGARITYSLK